ncbi:hypothetical protein BH20ACT6_BH20ACT6_16430 [soil metagenome]
MTAQSWAATSDAFEQAAHWFVRTAARGDGRWDSPALDQWTVRDLVGHTSRALLTVETYLGHDATGVDVQTPEDYFRRALTSVGDPAAVAQRGRDAGAALGPHPADSVAEIATRVLATVRVAAEDDLVATPVGGMRLVDYLPTRTFELTVHTCDLAAALDEPLEVPAAAAAASIHLLGGLAAGGGQAGPLLLAATGRTPLPTGFTVL